MIWPAPAATERMFPDLADVRSATTTQDDEGGIEESWSTLYSSIRAQVSGLPPDTEVRNAGGDFVRANHVVYLLGDIDVSEADQVVISGTTYDVVSVQRDSWAIATLVHVQERLP